jgi:tRNA nucleotidyltransferase/poly(A) polymerase
MTKTGKTAPGGTGVLSVAGAVWFKAKQTQAVFAALNRDGHEARAVGGAVRNALMGLAVKDVDFATTATPEQVAELAAKAGIRTVPTGLQHGTVTLVVEHHPYEVTTLRQDVETFGRHAAVAFTRDWAMDASRRDFTMNALYAGADGAVHDPLGGYPDLAARHVRFIGSARDRIREDYLRILRFFRFTANYGDGPDADGFSACIAERDGLGRLSAERVRAELCNILLARRPMRALAPMSEAGLLVTVLGGVVRLAHAERLIAIEAASALEADPIRRLGALAVMIEEDAGRLTERLRLSNAEAARLDAMAALRPLLTWETGADALKTALYRLGGEAYRNRMLIAWARSGASPDDPVWRAALTLPERWPAPVFPLRGQDLIAAGVERGPAMGQALRRLEEQWIASGFSLGREELLDLLKA